MRNTLSIHFEPNPKENLLPDGAIEVSSIDARACRRCHRYYVSPMDAEEMRARRDIALYSCTTCHILFRSRELDDQVRCPTCNSDGYFLSDWSCEHCFVELDHYEPIVECQWCQQYYPADELEDHLREHLTAAWRREKWTKKTTITIVWPTENGEKNA